MRGRTDQAKGALLQLRQIPEDDDYFVTEYHELIANIDHEQDTTSQWQSFKSLMTHCATDPSTRKRLVLVMIVQTTVHHVGRKLHHILRTDNLGQYGL
jgi:hypothetical protein